MAVPDQITLKSFHPHYNGEYILDLYNGRWMFQNTRYGDIWIHEKDNHWWIGHEYSIGQTNGYAWLSESHPWPIGPTQTWRRGGTDDYIPGAFATTQGN